MGVGLQEASKLKKDMLQQMSEMKAMMWEFVVWGTSISHYLRSNPPVIMASGEKAKAMAFDGPPTGNSSPSYFPFQVFYDGYCLVFFLR